MKRAMRVLGVAVLCMIVSVPAFAPRRTAAAPQYHVTAAIFPLWQGITGKEVGSKVGFLDWLNSVTGQYMKLHPNVSIKTVLYPWTTGQQKLYIQAASGAGYPDIIYQPATYMERLAHGAYLEPINNYLPASTLKDYYTNVVSRDTVNGKLYFWPWLTFDSAVFVNRKIFAERHALNLLPQNADRTWTFDQFLKAAQATTFKRADGTQVYGFGTFPSWTAVWLPWVWGYGARIFNDTGTKIILDQAPNRDRVIKGLTFLGNMENVSHVMPPGMAGMSSSNPQLQNMFWQGKLAMLSQEAPFYQSYQQAVQQHQIKPGTVDIYPVMTPSDGPNQPAPYIEDGGWAIFHQPNAGQLAVVMDLGKFLSNPANQRALTAASLFPTLKSAANGLYTGDPVMTFLQRAGHWTTPDLLLQSNVIGGFFGIEQPLDAMVQAVLNGSQSPEQAIQQAQVVAQQEVNTLLKQKLK